MTTPATTGRSCVVTSQFQTVLLAPYSGVCVLTNFYALLRELLEQPSCQDSAAPRSIQPLQNFFSSVLIIQERQQ